LGFEWEDLGILLAVRTGGVDLVLASIKAQALSKADGVGSRDWSAETLNRGEDLFEDVELDVWLEARVGLQNVLRAV
jgi:hypothetical protein